jgi:hypothetical protein
MQTEPVEAPDLIPPTEEVRRLLAIRASEANRLQRLLRLALQRDRDQERLHGQQEGAAHA